MDDFAVAGINPISIVNIIDNVLQNTFIQHFSIISSPKFSTFSFVLFLINFCRSVIWDVLLFKTLLLAAVSSARNIFTDRNSNVTETAQS